MAEGIGMCITTLRISKVFWNHLPQFLTNQPQSKVRPRSDNSLTMITAKIREILYDERKRKYMQMPKLFCFRDDLKRI